jgi:hypothetical protein
VGSFIILDDIPDIDVFFGFDFVGVHVFIGPNSARALWRVRAAFFKVQSCGSRQAEFQHSM